MVQLYKKGVPHIFAMLASDGGNTHGYPQPIPLSTGAQATPATVSYTHLDVYKRQTGPLQHDQRLLVNCAERHSMRR